MLQHVLERRGDDGRAVFGEHQRRPFVSRPPPRQVKRFQRRKQACQKAGQLSSSLTLTQA